MPVDRRSHDVQCPYCGEWQEICHDDGYGYTEDDLHEQECVDCEQTFTYQTMISFSYEAYKAPCLNGYTHEMKPVEHYPHVWPDWKRCKWCGKEERGEVNQEAWNRIANREH